MAKGLFITGTDTAIGKTRVSLALMHYLQHNECIVAGMKPIAAGCEPTPLGLRNEDALLLQRYSSVSLEYEILNPYAFEAPIAPHIAAHDNNVNVDLARIKYNFDLIGNKAHFIIVEGAGGWMVPISHQHSIADIVQTLDIPVVLVVGLRLGCLNHAQLSYAKILQDKCRIAGWIVNDITPDMPRKAENISYLRSRFGTPLLAELKHNSITLDVLDEHSLLQLLT